LAITGIIQVDKGIVANFNDPDEWSGSEVLSLFFSISGPLFSTHLVYNNKSATFATGAGQQNDRQG
jgi:hypothetical protein